MTRDQLEKERRSLRWWIGITAVPVGINAFLCGDQIIGGHWAGVIVGAGFAFGVCAIEQYVTVYHRLSGLPSEENTDAFLPEGAPVIPASPMEPSRCPAPAGRA